MAFVHYIATRPDPGTYCPHTVWTVISPDRNTAHTLFRILQDNTGKQKYWLFRIIDKSEFTIQCHVAGNNHTYRAA
jgi:hypothetical protein